MTSRLLSIDGLTVQFGGLTALSNVSIEVHPGEVVGLIGPNGAGKTTLFNVLTGLYTPEAGAFALSGRSLRGAGRTQRQPSRAAARIDVLYTSMARRRWAALPFDRSTS